MEGAGQFAGPGKGRVEALRFGKSVGVDRDEGVERRPGLIVGIDPVEIHPDQLGAGQLAREIGGMNGLDRRLFQ